MILRSMSGVALTLALSFPALVAAQDRGRDGDRERDHDRMTRIDRGTVIPVRLNNPIDVNREENRVYTGTVDQDVRGENGRLAIPRGSQVELRVRVERDHDLVLDLDSVSIHGERYELEADANRIPSQRDNSLVGSIVGAVTGNEVRGPAVRVRRGTVLSFRIERPLVWHARHG